MSRHLGRALMRICRASLPQNAGCTTSVLACGSALSHASPAASISASCALRGVTSTHVLTGFQQWQARSFSSSVPDYSKEVDEINTLFVEARDEIEYALEEAETTYFNESVEQAQKVVDECLGKWSGLLASLPEAESQKLQRSMGLKMEQLKAEFEGLRKTHLEDH